MSNVVEFRAGRARRPSSRRHRAYAELAVTTNFSFLRGASHPKEFIPQAAALGLAGIGIADRNSVAGVVRAYHELGRWNQRRPRREKTNRQRSPVLKLVVGARLVFADGTPDILAYPQNRKAWGRLTRLLTVGKSRGEKAECILYFDDLLEHIAGLNLIVMPPARIKTDALCALLARLKSATVKQAGLARRQHALSRRRQSPARAARGDRRTHARSAHRRERRAVSRAGAAAVAGRHDLHPRARHHRHGRPAARSQCGAASETPAEMARLFRRAPEAIDRTLRFLDRCNFSLGELEKTEYPDENRVGFANPQEALVRSPRRASERRYPDGAQPEGPRGARPASSR